MYTLGQGKGQIMALIGILISFWYLSIGDDASKAGWERITSKPAQVFNVQTNAPSPELKVYPSSVHSIEFSAGPDEITPRVAGEKFGPAKT